MKMPMNQNSRQQNDSVNARGFQFFNKDGFEGSTLLVNMWNQNIALKMHPAKEKAKQTESSVYDYEHSVNLVLPPIAATTIFTVCKEKLVPALVEGREFTICVPVGQNSGFVVSTGVKRFGTVRPYVSILKNIQAGTLNPEEMMSYEFNKSSVIEGYDGTSKDGISQKFEYTELIYFIYALERITMALIGAENHARRYIERNYNNQVFGLYKGLAEKAGVSFYPQRENNYRRSSSGGNVFNSNTDGYTTGGYGNPAPSTEPLSGEPVQVDSLADLDSFM